MIYLYLSDDTIKSLTLSKTLFGQYTVSYFQKKHTTPLVQKGQVVTIDLLASGVKEALTLSTPSKVKDKEVCLILPQIAFSFARYAVPHDISETAIKPFLEDKIRTQTDFSLNEVIYDYVVIKQQEESNILFFAIKKETMNQYDEALRLLGLSVSSIVPDTLCYFTLFAKTLRRDKKENILYVFYGKGDAHGYVYDSLGLVRDKQYRFHDPIEETLHATVQTLSHEHIKLNRVILSGVKSETVRQDHFTKKVGVWTNPLKKIIPQFYGEYLKLITATDQAFPLLDFDVCLGAFIAFCEQTVFSVKAMRKTNRPAPKNTAPQKSKRAVPVIHRRDIVVFFISFILSFAIIFSYFRFKNALRFPFSTQTVAPTATPSIIAPTLKPTPTISPVDKKALKIKVLNGGGVRGKAGIVKVILQDAGYGEILTDNADNFDYEKTLVQITDDKRATFSLLQKDLADYVSLDKPSALDDETSADVVLIIGKDFK